MNIFRNISYKILTLLWVWFFGSVQLFAESDVKKFTIDFYGHLLAFDLSADFYSQREKLFDKLSYEDQVLQLEKDSQVDQLKSDLDAYERELKLDGISYLMLVKKVALKLSKSNEKFKTIFTYVVLNKKGYDVILGANDHRLTLYGHTGFEIKNVLFVNRHSKSYYDLSFDQHKTQLNECLLDLSYHTNPVPIKLNRLRPPLLNRISRNKILPFEYDGSIYFFTINLNQSLVNYYHDLPAIEIGKVYLNYGLSEKGNNSLVEQLKEATLYLGKEKTVDFILSFVQAMEFGRDEDVVGQEKFAFPEESLAANYTDCEDRSMLFAYLVREVAHLQSVGLLYPAHMNVAVESWRKKQDSDFNAYEMDFIVCEPSAKGLKAGQQTMNLSSARLVKW